MAPTYFTGPITNFSPVLGNYNAPLLDSLALSLSFFRLSLKCVSPGVLPPLPPLLLLYILRSFEGRWECVRERTKIEQDRDRERERNILSERKREREIPAGVFVSPQARRKPKTRATLLDAVPPPPFTNTNTITDPPPVIPPTSSPYIPSSFPTPVPFFYFSIGTKPGRIISK